MSEQVIENNAGQTGAGAQAPGAAEPIAALTQEIAQLKEQRDAVILAHYYVPPEVQAAADYVGDSFALAKLAVDLPQQTIVLCGVEFMGPGAEDLAFNSGGACPTCSGTGIARTVNRAALVPDESKTIDEGAVVVWGSLMWDLMKQVCGAMGVRTDVPFCQLTPEERDIVFNGPAEKRHILYKSKKGDDFAELDFTYYNAVYTVENALAKAKDEKGLRRVAKFLTEGPRQGQGR